MKHPRLILTVLLILRGASPAFGAQAYYVSAVLSDVYWHIDNSGAVSKPASAAFTVCPAGVTPTWNWTADPTLNSKCLVTATNSLGDQLINEGHSWLILHTGAATDLTATTNIMMATGINASGDIVGLAEWNGSNFTVPFTGVPCTTSVSGYQCRFHGVLLRHGTTTLIDLNTLLSPTLTNAGAYSNELVFIANGINDSGQILTASPGPYNGGGNANKSSVSWPPGCTTTNWILTPCTAGSCPTDVYTYSCPK